VATGTFSDTTTQDITDVAQWTLVPASGVASFLDPQNPSVATGSALGSATIKADWNGAPTGSAKLNVTGATLSKITVTPDKSFIPPAGLLQYTATGTFSDNSTQTLLNVAWDSQFPSIASIDPFNGLATGNGAGTTTITAKLGSVQGQTSLLVTGSQLQSIAVTPANATIAEQTGLALTATGTFQDGTSRDITGSVHWSSSALAVATVGNSGNRQGIVLGLTPGQTNITAALNGVTGQTNLIVTAATLMSIDITPTAPTISLGQTQQLKATGHFSDGSMQDLTLFATWTTDTATVAVVDAAGLVTAAGKGSANITATMNGQSNHILITVQ
jgi:uncharacterized protein YjdB